MTDLGRSANVRVCEDTRARAGKRRVFRRRVNAAGNKASALKACDDYLIGRADRGQRVRACESTRRARCTQQQDEAHLPHDALDIDA
jgi:hypothetical protein